MGIDYSSLAHPKGKLRVEEKREQRLSQAEQERTARAAVRKRDGGKCVIPGCKEKAEHLHHITYRSHSKKRKWHTGNLASLCVGHHAMVHAGRIRISGDADVHLDVFGDKKDLSFKL